MNKSLAISILGFALGATPILAATTDPGTDGGEHRGGSQRFQRVADYLGLSEDQQTTWKSLFEKHKEETQPLRQEGRDLHQRLKAALNAENPDPAAVGAATLALKEHRAKMKAAHEAFTAQLTGTLTPEQKTKFEAFKSAHRWHRHGGPRGHKPPADETPSSSSPPVKG
jgi:Spy/CpxP family protein refolding chaperone